MRALSLMLFGLWVSAAGYVVAQQPRNAGAPETFSGTAQVESASGVSASAPIAVHLDRYTPDFDRTAVEQALKSGGYPAFLPALRKSPTVGYVELAGQKFAIRWARETAATAGRTIVVVTDTPVAFLGGAQANYKPRAGYEVGLIELMVNGQGTGNGRMAAAARVKPGGETGVQIDDYAEAPIVLVKITRK